MPFPCRFLSRSLAVFTLLGFAFGKPVYATFVKEFTTQQDFSGGTHQRTGYVPDLGGLALPEIIDCMPIVWVPSPEVNAVLKLDGRTGRQLGVYRMGPANGEWKPCAVATDPLGNAYVACSCPGRTGKIVQIRPWPLGDASGDGIVATSKDSDGNGLISRQEVLDWGKDDCVTSVIDLGPETEPSALVFDYDGQLWVALERQSTLAKVDLTSRNPIAYVSLSGRPSALLADRAGSLWVLSRRDHALYHISTVTQSIVGSYDLGDSSPAAACVDQYGRVWVADEYGALIMVHPVDGAQFKYATDYCGGFAGIATDSEGDIWASCPVKGMVTHFSPLDGSVINEVYVGGTPQQLCFDSDGWLWVFNEDARSASRIDTLNHRVALTVPTLLGSRSNSPFTSSVFVRGIPTDGFWTTLIDAGTSGTAWGTISWEAEENGGRISVEVRTANTPAELPASPYVPVRNGEAMSVGNGRYLALRVSLTRGPRYSPVLKRIRVEAKNQPPDVTNAVALIDPYASSSNGYYPVVVAGVVDPDGGPVAIKITGVTIAQQVEGTDLSDRDPRIVGIGGSTVWLPQSLVASCVCTISFEAVDSEGAATSGSVQLDIRNTSRDTGQISKNPG